MQSVLFKAMPSRKIETHLMRLLTLGRILAFALCLHCLPVPIAAQGVPPIAVFPLQELGEGRNDANLLFSRVLAEHLADNGNQIIGPETVIEFMAANRIRTLGHLDTLQVSSAEKDLGAAFVLLGTVSQRKERPEATLGLTLTLVRTYDARTVWSYIGSFSVGQERKILGIGEPRTTDDLIPLALQEIVAQWPWRTISQAQQVSAINLDLTMIRPRHVRPGDEVRGRVRLRESWPAGREPRVFFKVDDQLYPTITTGDGSTYEADWVAGEQNGQHQVMLLVEWPQYQRSESVLLGNFLVDGTPPLFEITLPGTTEVDGIPVFTTWLKIRPRMIVRKPLSQWRLSLISSNEGEIGDATGQGNMPRELVWKGRGTGVGGDVGDGLYEVVLEAWDQAGNYAKASKQVMMKRAMTKLAMSADRDEQDISIELDKSDRIPLKYWRLEMWTKEGKILTQTEGQELPAKVEFELPETGSQEVEGFLSYQDILGKKVFKKLSDFLPDSKPKKAGKKEKSNGISEKWVDEF